MRPVLLEMRGFASFRERAVVDFRDADFFALVGPTGAGKSTVIDALTFALYGSVPRWNNKAAVSFALAPTTTQAVVRLVFDVGPQRYVVAREVRRVGKAGNATMRACRLERLADPDGVGEAQEETVVLEADSRVTGAVERLLGLTFDDFCQCVVLPQGEFAEFLRATPKHRQEILLKLLGAERYDLIRQQANARAAAAAQQVAFLTEQVGGLAYATDEAVAAAEADERAVADRAEQVLALLPTIRTARAEVEAAVAALARLRTERDTLAEVRAPRDIDALDGELTAADATRQAASDREATARRQESAARTLLEQAPSRGPLEKAREQYAERTLLRWELPTASAAHEAAAAEVVDAEHAHQRAFTDRERAREALSEATQSAQAAQALLTRLEAEHHMVSAVRSPAGIADLAGRLAGQAQTRDRLLSRLVAAEEEAESARAALGTGAGLARLEVAREALDAVGEHHRGLPAPREAHRRAAADHAEATSVLDAANQRLTQARSRLESARSADLALGLRRHLHVGEACPVCGQDVVARPPAADDPALDAAEQIVEDAEREAGAASTLLARALASQARTGADLAAAQQTAAAAVERARDALDRAGVATPLTLDDESVNVLSPEEVSKDDASLDEVRSAVADQIDAARKLERRNAEALARVAAGRADLRDAQAADERLQQEVGTARTTLRKARDPLVALGAPQVDDEDPAAGWASLTRWAEQEAGRRQAALLTAQEDLTGALAAQSAAAARDHAAQQGLQRAAARQREAVAASAQAGAELTRCQVRLAGLDAVLDGAAAEHEVSATLAHIDALERTAARAYREWQEARAGLDSADRAVSALTAKAEAGWARLRAVRDACVALGAPDVGGQHPGASIGLTAAWLSLQAWAAAEVDRREAGLADAERDLARATAAAQKPDDDVRALLDGLGAVPDDGDLLVTAPAALAAAAERTRASTQRIRERRTRAAQLAQDCAQATQREHVARALGGLLRSDNFPRWLEAAALDALVVDASHALLELSSGQFELTHDNREFFVVDHADADSRRSVRTLSGGETFQASLALALALSSQLSSLSGAGAAQLDSIFLDEGFGTLDPATLEVVAATLENLANTDRMVGVVTHVSALAERIPVRYRVQRDGRTSSVVREG